MILRSYRREDSPIIAKWLRTETELYQWSADRYGFFPLLPYSIDDSTSGQLTATVSSLSCPTASTTTTPRK